MNEAADITIIGAGIIGIATAAHLAEAGFKVVVFDRTGICEETSSGNAGAFAFSDVLPLAHKGMMAQVPKWLADPLGPLSIPPAYLPKLLPWLYRFWRAGAPTNYDDALATQAGLMTFAREAWAGLMARSSTSDMLRESGSLELYETEAEFEASLPNWTVRGRFGIAHRHLTKHELPDYQSGLSDRFVRATFVPEWKTVTDPKLLGEAIWRYAEGLGARFVHATVTHIDAGDTETTIHLAGGMTHRTQKLIIAAGAWSHFLARSFGDRIPLETERGYNTTLPVGAFDVKRMLIFPAHGFVITPLSTGLRVGGAVELGGLRRPPNFARSEAMLKKAQTFLPGLDTRSGRQWMGYRPSLPDSLPIIGRAKGRGNVFYAFGHGHLGLTQSAATGALIRDLVLENAPALDMSPFSAQRF